MASINRRLKKGMNAHSCVPGSVEKKGGKTLTCGPHGAARERGGKRAPTGGPYCAVRGGKGGGARAVRAERAAPLGRVRVAGGGRGAGPTTAQGQG